MFRRNYSLGNRVLMAAALALGASSAAMADDSSMGRFGGDSYAYFNNQPVVRGNAAGITAWRQSHPNGLTERELQALSSSDLSGFVGQLNPPVFASAPADPMWRQSHPNGLTERELQALSSSSLASWQGPDRSRAVANVAESPSKETFAARR
jgi:hypothetical protein